MEHDYIPVRACPICEGRSGIVLGRLSYTLFDDLEISGSKTLIRCTVCGMMYDDVAFGEEQLQAYYRRNEHYAASSAGGTGGLSPDNLKRYDRIIDSSHPDPKAIILDVGCGQGGFVARCVQRGFSAAGVEPSDKSRHAGLSEGLALYASLHEYAAKHPEGKIGTVVISHVLEHLLNPSKMLKELALFAPKAQVYIEVPDAASYLAPNAIRWHELYFEHLNHYCKEMLCSFAAAAGVEVTRAESAPFSQDQADSTCLFLVGRLGDTPGRHARISTVRKTAPVPLLSLPHADIPQDGRPVAVWGISQYAMLLMGSLPQLRHVDRLFDKSPAKVGRTIRGIPIEDPKEMGTLSKATTLVLPYSQYSKQMLKEIRQSGAFRGTIIEI